MKTLCTRLTLALALAAALVGCATTDAEHPWPAKVVGVNEMQPTRPIQTSLMVRRMEASPAATVGLRVHVDAQGQVLRAAVLESGGSLAMDGAALAAMRKMTFVPYRENGAPMAVTVMVPLHFPAVPSR